MSKADKTPNAIFVSEDEKVSFDEAGYRLDSLGHRTYNNAGIGGESKPRYTEKIQEDMARWQKEVEQYEKDMRAFLAAQAAGIVGENPGTQHRYTGPSGRSYSFPSQPSPSGYPIRPADAFSTRLSSLSGQTPGWQSQRYSTPTVDFAKQALAQSAVKLPGMDDQQPGVAPLPPVTWR